MVLCARFRKCSLIGTFKNTPKRLVFESGHTIEIGGNLICCECGKMFNSATNCNRCQSKNIMSVIGLIWSIFTIE